jgi:hypothetical protein
VNSFGAGVPPTPMAVSMFTTARSAPDSTGATPARMLDGSDATRAAFEPSKLVSPPKAMVTVWPLPSTGSRAGVVGVVGGAAAASAVGWDGAAVVDEPVLTRSAVGLASSAMTTHATTPARSRTSAVKTSRRVTGWGRRPAVDPGPPAAAMVRDCTGPMTRNRGTRKSQRHASPRRRGRRQICPSRAVAFCTEDRAGTGRPQRALCAIEDA